MKFKQMKKRNLPSAILRFRPLPPPGDLGGSFSSAALGFRPLLGGVATGSGAGAASVASVASVASTALGLGVGDFLPFAGPGGGVIVHRRLEPKFSRFDQYDPESPVESDAMLRNQKENKGIKNLTFKIDMMTVTSLIHICYLYLSRYLNLRFVSNTFWTKILKSSHCD